MSQLIIAAQAHQADPIALAMVSALLLLVVAALLRKRFGHKASVAEQPPQSVQAPQDAPTAPGSAGQLKLHNVEPKTAAMLMAIVANTMDKPLNELRFISIREVTDNEV